MYITTKAGRYGFPDLTDREQIIDTLSQDDNLWEDIAAETEEKESAEEQNRKGYMYLKGIGVKRSSEKALVYYEKAAGRGHACAQYITACIYSRGLHDREFYVEAVCMLKAASKQGCTQARDALMKIQSNGTDTAVRKEERLQCCSPKEKSREQTAGRKNTETPCSVSDKTCILSCNCPLRDITDAELTGISESAEACFFRGRFRLYRSLCKSDYENAFRWFKKGAAMGHAESLAYLSDMYKQGLGCTKDPDKSLQMLKKSAVLGFAGAQYELGRCYFYGKDLPENREEGIRWIEKSAEQNYSEACLVLGCIYISGTGTEPDHEKALKLFKKSAQQGNADAEYILGCIYLCDLPPDRENALYWFKKAAAKKHEYAVSALNELRSKKFRESLNTGA